MANRKVTWLGDNVTKKLTNPETGKSAGVGEDITLSDAQIKALRRNGHMFADPKSDEAEAARPPSAQNTTPAKTPATA